MKRQKIAEWARGMVDVFESSPKGTTTEQLTTKINAVLDRLYDRKRTKGYNGMPKSKNSVKRGLK